MDAVATVISPDAVRSPVTGRGAAFFRIEIVERSVRKEVSLGSFVLGDVVTLRTDDGREVRVVVRRAELGFVTDPAEGSLAVPPPEVVPFLKNASGLGDLVYREHAVVSGARLRLRASVDPRGDQLVVRADEGPVRLDEALFR